MKSLLSAWKFLALAAVGVFGAGAALVMAEPERAEVVSATPDKPFKEAAAVAPAEPVKPAVDEAFVIKRILPINGPIRYGEWHWNEEGAPAEGPLVITVDLEARVISVFRGGYEIGAAAVLLGTDEKPTPLGVFPISQKKRHHVSNLYGAPMPFMQRLTDDGIALHASNVELGYASHGCIGMPEAFAEKVFGATKLGDKVYITRGKQIGMGDSLVG